MLSTHLFVSYSPYLSPYRPEESVQDCFHLHSKSIYRLRDPKLDRNAEEIVSAETTLLIESPYIGIPR